MSFLFNKKCYYIAFYIQVFISFGILVCFLTFLIGSQELKKDTNELLTITRQIHQGAHEAMSFAYDLANSEEMSQLTTDYSNTKSKLIFMSDRYKNLTLSLIETLDMIQNGNYTTDLFSLGENTEIITLIKEALKSFYSSSNSIKELSVNINDLLNTTVLMNKIKIFINGI